MKPMTPKDVLRKWRADFEAWARASGLYDMRREESDADVYQSVVTQSTWEGWRAHARRSE